MSTEHATGAADWLPEARSVILDADGSARYFSLSGFWTDLMSMDPDDIETHADVVLPLHAAVRRDSPRPVRDRRSPRSGRDGRGVPGARLPARARRRH